MNEQGDGVRAGGGPKPRNVGGLQRGKETDSLLDPPEAASLANTLTLAAENPILDFWTL